MNATPVRDEQRLRHGTAGLRVAAVVARGGEQGERCDGEAGLGDRSAALRDFVAAGA